MISRYWLLYWLRPKRYEWCIGFKNSSGLEEYIRLPAKKKGIKELWRDGGKVVEFRRRMVDIDITGEQYSGGKICREP